AATRTEGWRPAPLRRVHPEAMLGVRRAVCLTVETAAHRIGLCQRGATARQAAVTMSPAQVKTAQA
ncbi:MAG: hypothetical protein ACRD8U_17780, partial [Pyrinomonadaceae bacterium]